MAETTATRTVVNSGGTSYGVAVRSSSAGDIQYTEPVVADVSGNAPTPLNTLGTAANSAVVSVTATVADAVTASAARRFVVFQCLSGTVYLGPTGVTATSYFVALNAGDAPFVVDVTSGARDLWRCIAGTGLTATLHCGTVS